MILEGSDFYVDKIVVNLKFNVLDQNRNILTEIQMWRQKIKF